MNRTEPLDIDRIRVGHTVPKSPYLLSSHNVTEILLEFGRRNQTPAVESQPPRILGSAADLDAAGRNGMTPIQGGSKCPLREMIQG